MTKTKEIRVPANQIPVSRRADASIAVVGNPNSGKSTLFNRLTGLRQRIGNYPGVTVERHVGTLKVDDKSLQLVDLPGTHALSAHSLEEQIAVDVILGHMDGTATPDGILAVVDATNLYQGLYLVQQLLDLERPLVVALTMADAAEVEGLKIDVDALTAKLGGVPICPRGRDVGAGRREAARRAVPYYRDNAPRARQDLAGTDRGRTRAVPVCAREYAPRRDRATADRRRHGSQAGVSRKLR